MTEGRAQADWSRCQADSSCSGSALPPGGRCLGYLDPDDLKEAIKRAKADGLDARGVTVTPSLLSDILSLLDRTDQDLPVVPNARFDKATFTGPALFGRATFTETAWFDEVTFTRDAESDEVSLSGRLSFRTARAAKRLRVAVRGSGTGEIGPTVNLQGASFAGPAVVTASPAGVVKLVSFEQTDTANLTVAGLDLSDCLFLDAINLERLRIDGDLLLHPAPGWWRARLRLLLEEGALRHWPGWENRESQDNRQLRKGREDTKHEPAASDFYYRDMEIRRILVSGWERLLNNLCPLLSGYGLRASRSLAALRCWPDWETRRSQDKLNPNLQRRERASRLQAVYRDLRKGREDAKDEPGAADFYYGEMEMRRKAAGGWSGGC